MDRRRIEPGFTEVEAFLQTVSGHIRLSITKPHYNSQKTMALLAWITPQLCLICSKRVQGMDGFIEFAYISRWPFSHWQR